MLRVALQDAIGSFDPLVKLLSLRCVVGDFAVGDFSHHAMGACVIAGKQSIRFDLPIDWAGTATNVRRRGVALE